MSYIEISSRQNEHVKHTAKLLASKNFREKEKAFVVSGKRLCEELFKKNSPDVLKCFLTKETYESLQEPLKSVYNNTKSKFIVKESVLKKITDTKNPQGIVCVCKLDKKVLTKKDIYENKKYIVLENISDPGNLGTIIRTAESFFIDGLILSGNGVDLYNPKVVRSSMGSIFRLPIMEHNNTSEVLKILKEKNIKTYAAVLDDEAKILTDIKFSKSCAVFIGNEGSGLLKETYDNCDEKIFININKNVESLNASVATAILIWEMSKRKDN